MDIPTTIDSAALRSYLHMEGMYLKMALVKVNKINEAYSGTRGHKHYVYSTVKETIYGQLGTELIVSSWGRAPEFLKEGAIYIMAVSGRAKDVDGEYHGLLAAQPVDEDQSAAFVSQFKKLIAAIESSGNSPDDK